ncbi:hypothetical protein [Membranihabitans maritimus]|uniref:hypothetical protein n=1 Tax=Membranihabitans maritimus TaxID=2904244 RepID=UPI001F33B731|nr:hypothetical protein [Membranihabitans maritimus]
MGLDQDRAYAWSRTRMGGWRIAQSPILVTTVTIERLKARIYLSMVEYYQQVRSIPIAIGRTAVYGLF